MDTLPYHFSEQFEHTCHQLNQAIENVIRCTASCLLCEGQHNKVVISLTPGQLRVGEYESLIKNYPQVNEICIEAKGVMIKLELIDEYEPFESFFTFSILDKIEILKVLETELHERRIGVQMI